jgi:hypothetical protein
VTKFLSSGKTTYLDPANISTVYFRLLATLCRLVDFLGLDDNGISQHIATTHVGCSIQGELKTVHLVKE